LIQFLFGTGPFLVKNVLAFGPTPVWNQTVPVATVLAFGPVPTGTRLFLLEPDCSYWNCAGLSSDSFLELDQSYWNCAGLWSDSFWNEAVTVETVLFRNFPSYPREKPLRNGIPAIKMLLGCPTSLEPHFMFKDYDPSSHAFLTKRMDLTKSNLRTSMAIMRNFQSLFFSK